MNQGATVFKFCSAAGAAAILRKKCIFVTSPLDLNDPFEMRPAWTDEHQERHRKDELRRNCLVGGMPAFAVMQGGKLKPIGELPAPPEPPKMDVNNQRGIADQHNQKVFELLHNRYRVLSFCTGILDLADGRDEGDEKQTLIWSHYADMFQGVCLAIDPTKINNGIKSGGFIVEYDPTRRSLPPSFYDCFLSLERDRVEMGGVQFSGDPESGLLLMNHNREERFETQLLEFLHYKSPAWSYEREVRMIYDLAKLRVSADYRTREFPCESCKAAKKEADQCEHSTFRDAVHVPPDAIQAVIFGTDTSVAAIRECLGVLNDSSYVHVMLFWSSLHSEHYVIQYNKSDRTYAELMQKLRTENVAHAKGHVRYSKSATKLLPAGKGVNFIMKKTTDKSG